MGAVRVDDTGLWNIKELPPSSRRQAAVHWTGTGFVKDDFFQCPLIAFFSISYKVLSQKATG